MAWRAMAWPFRSRARADQQHDVIVRPQLQRAAAQRAVALGKLLVGHAVGDDVEALGGEFEAVDDLVRDETGIADDAAHAVG